MYSEGEFRDPRTFYTVSLTPQRIAAYETLRSMPSVAEVPVLRIGEHNAELDGLLAQTALASAAFITAANPRGEPRSDAENDAAMASLRASLSWRYLEGEGRDPEGGWPAEPSVLILGIGRAEAEALGRRLEQNAIVFVERGNVPELVLLATMRLVIDTQVWLDWLVFDDPSVAALRQTIAMENVEVLIDDACLAELERVLAYRSQEVESPLPCRLPSNARRVGMRNDAKSCRVARSGDQKFLEIEGGAKDDAVPATGTCAVNGRCSPMVRMCRRRRGSGSLAPVSAKGVAGGEQIIRSERCSDRVRKSMQAVLHRRIYVSELVTQS